MYLTHNEGRKPRTVDTVDTDWLKASYNVVDINKKNMAFGLSFRLLGLPAPRSEPRGSEEGSNPVIRDPKTSSVAHRDLRAMLLFGFCSADPIQALIANSGICEYTGMKLTIYTPRSPANPEKIYPPQLPP